MQVSVYSRAARVRLALDGRTIGEQPIDPANGITAQFTVPWQPGVLTATALDGDQVVAVKELRTTGPAAKLRVAPETEKNRAARAALIYLPIDVLDASGARVPDAAVPLTVTVEGEAELCALGSADPQVVGSLADARATTFRGRALAILRSTGRAGTAKVQVSAPGLPAAVVMIAFAP